MKNKRIYIIPGKKITSLESFWKVIGEVFNGPGGYFGSNYDSFGDCLSGGYGTPENEDYIIRWEDVIESKEALGHEETLKYLEETLKRAHSTWKDLIIKDIELAKGGRVRTIFDVLVDIITDAENIELQLT